MPDQDPNPSAPAPSPDQSQAAQTPTPPVVAASDPLSPTPMGTTPPPRQGTPIPALAAPGAGEAGVPGYAPRFNLREAVEKIEADKREGGGGGDDAPVKRAPDGKFLPKEGAEPASDDAAAPAAGDAAPAAGAAPTGTAAASGVPDMEELAKTIPTMGSKDKKRYTQWKASYDAVKAEAATAKQRATELETKNKELEAKASATTLPKDVEEELTTLRGRSRAWEITTDPTFQKEHDAPIAANLKRVEDAFTQTWKELGLDEAGMKAPLDHLRKNNFSWNAVTNYLDELREHKRPGDALKIESMLRRNDDLNQARADAIASQQTQSSQTAAQRAEAFKAQQETQKKMQDIAHRTTLDSFTAGEAEIKKLLPSLVAPEAPSDKDTPAVRTAKLAAQAEYQGAVEAVKAEFARFAPDPKDHEKTARLTGEFQSLVMLGLLAKSHLLPRAAKELAARDALIAERDTKLASFKRAGAVNGAHLAAAQHAPTGKLNDAANDPNRKPGDLIRGALADVQRKQQGTFV